MKMLVGVGVTPSKSVYAGLKLLEIIGGAHPKFADKEDFPQGLSLTHCELALSFW